MSTYLQFAVLGLGLAAVYIGLANGLFLVFRSTGIINFAQGATAMWGAYVFAQLRLDGTLVLPIGSIEFGDEPSVVVSLLIGLVSAGLLGLLTHWIVFRPVRRAPALAQVVVSVALMLTMQALVVIRFGPNDIAIDSLIPSGTIDLFGITLSSAEFVMVAIMLATSVLVWGYFRFARAGAATRAAAENERGAVVLGFSPNRLAAIAMVMGSLISTLGVILGSSLTGLNPSNYTLLVVPALAVLLIARMQSVGTIAIAAVILGIFQSLLNLFAGEKWWPVWAQSGVDQVVPFVLVIVILVVFGKKLPARGTLQAIKLPDVKIPRFRPEVGVLVVVATGLLLAVTSGTFRFGLTWSIILMLLALSYVILTGYLGQISLAQAAFAGAAGFTLSKVTTNWNMPFVPAIVFCSLVAALLGMMVALPAFRIRGAQLAIVTIAAALAIERFVFNNYSLTPVTGNQIAGPNLFGLNLSVRDGSDIARLEFSLTVLVVAAIVVWGFIRIASGDTGRTFLAVRANERAAASSGIDVRKVKLIGFGLSAFVAGVAGCLMGYSAGQLSAESFTVFVGLQVLAVAYLGGITSFGGAVIAGLIGPLGVVYVLIHNFFDLGNYYALISGIALIVTAILNPVGIAGEANRIGALVQARRRPVTSASGRGDLPTSKTQELGNRDRKVATSDGR